MFISRKKVNFFEIVRTGRVDEMVKLNKFATTKGFSEDDPTLLAKSHGADDETPLLLTIEHSFKPMFEYLVEKLNAPIGQSGRFHWNGKIYFKITPLLAAIISNQHSFVEYMIQKHKIEICLGQGEQIKMTLKLAHYYGCGECERRNPLRISYLIARENNESSSLCAFSSIMSSSLLSPLQKVDTLELIGSAFILYCPHTACLHGIRFLKEALVLRQSIEDGQSDTAGNAVKNAVEQLEQEAGDYHRLCIHAFKISQRTLNQPMNLGNHPSLLYFPLLRYAKKCFDHLEYEHVVNISQLILQPFQPCQWESLTDEIRSMICDMFRLMTVSALSDELIHRLTGDVKELLLTFPSVMTAIEFATADASHTLEELAKQRTNRPRLMQGFYDRKTGYIVQLVQLVCVMLPKLNQQQIIQIKENLKRFIQLADKPELPNHSSLHPVCGIEHPIFVGTNLVKLLLEVGADPNALDSEGNTPLYVLAKTFCWEFMKYYISAARMLINSGASLDKENRITLKTARHLFKKKEEIYRRHNGGHSCCFYPLFDQVLSLSCLCANVIVQHRLPFDVELPSRLHDYIRYHVGYELLQNRTGTQ